MFAINWQAVGRQYSLSHSSAVIPEVSVDLLDKSVERRPERTKFICIVKITSVAIMNESFLIEKVNHINSISMWRPQVFSLFFRAKRV